MVFKNNFEKRSLVALPTCLIMINNVETFQFCKSETLYFVTWNNDNQKIPMTREVAAFLNRRKILAISACS